MQLDLSSATHGNSRRLALFALVVAGLLPRLNGIDQPLPTIEAWVANSATAHSWKQVFYYHDWLQTSPPLFLVAVRGMAGLFHLSNWSLRLAPLLFGLAAMVLVALLSARAFPAPFALCCASLAAFSPLAITYSREVKQYTGDAASTALLLLLLWRYRERPDSSAYWRVVAACFITLLLSYTATMILPLMLLVMAATEPHLVPDQNRRRVKFLRCGWLMLLASVESAAIYLVFIRPNVSPRLYTFWRDLGGYLTTRNPVELALFYARYFLGMPLYTLLPHDIDLLSAYAAILRVPRILLLLLLVVIVVMLARLAAKCRNDSRRLWLAIFAGVPVLTLAAFNMAGLYPVGSRKMVLFLLPCTAIGITLLLEALVGSQPSALAWTAAISLALATAFAGGWEGHRVVLEEDAEGPLGYVQKTAAPGDLFYVHASIAEPVKLYFRMFHWSAPGGGVTFGDTGYSCCTRKPDPSDASAMNQEMSSLLARSPGRQVWLLFTGRPEPWPKLHRELAVERFASAQCGQHSAPAFSGARLLEFTCPAGPLSADSR